MRTRNVFVIAFAAVLFAAQSAYVSPTYSQTPDRSEQDRLARVMDPNTSVEEFRQEYDNYLVEMENVVRLWNSVPALHAKNDQPDSYSVERLETARRGVANMSADDLTKVRDIYAKFPGWRDPSASQRLSRRIEAMQAGKSKGSNVANAITPDVCPNEPDVASNADILVERLTVITLSGAADAIPEELAPLKIAAIALAAVDESILAGYETGRATYLECISATKVDIQGIVDHSESDLLFDLSTYVTNGTHDTSVKIDQSTTQIVDNDNTNTTTILNALDTKSANVTTAINAAKTAIVNNDNSNATNILNNATTNKTDVINNANANSLTITTAITAAKNEVLANAASNKNELRDLMLRTQIEADLAEADNATYVAFYITPASMGGHLEFARSIVAETIAKLGGKKNANAFLVDADSAIASGDYKTAYMDLRKAYKAAMG